MKTAQLLRHYALLYDQLLLMEKKELCVFFKVCRTAALIIFF